MRHVWRVTMIVGNRSGGHTCRSRNQAQLREAREIAAASFRNLKVRMETPPGFQAVGHLAEKRAEALHQVAATDQTDKQAPSKEQSGKL